MKTSFLKNFFNNKDNGSKNHFNIHSVDLDDSDDVIVCNESFFQKNNSMNPKEMLKNKFVKSDDLINEKKLNLFSLNDSISSNSSCEMKSPMIANNFNLAKIRQSPLSSPVFNREKQVKSKSGLEFVPPASMSNILKTPKKDDKILQFSSFKAKNLNSPSIKFMNLSNLSDSNKNKNNFSISPPKTKTAMSPSIAKIKGLIKDDNISHSKSQSMFHRDEVNNKYLNNMQKNEYIEGKHDKEFETYEKLNKIDSYHRNRPESLQDINELIYHGESEESQNLKNENECVEVEDNRLKVLHMKLKLESEKIQKWKDNIEKDLHLKIKTIAESDKIIESLRSSNLDLQMRQENISLNYREEIECRSEVTKKIENSRQLCNILKEKIADIEFINLNHNNENDKMMQVQDHILYVINLISNDIHFFSDTQMQCLNDLKNKIELKEIEIENIKIDLSENKKIAEIESDKYNSEIKSLSDQLVVKNEDNNNLNIENQKVLIEKDEIQNILLKEKKMNESLLNEKTNLFEDYSNLKILNENINETNLNLAKDIVVKENIINELNRSLLELNLEYSTYKKETDETKLVNDQSFKDKENEIFQLKSDILIKENEFKTLNQSMNLKYEEMDIKISLKESSISNLTKVIIEKEDQILNLEELISKLNNDIKEITENFSNLKLENDLTVKNAAILKSSNQDLREELNNYKVEINAHVEENAFLKKDLINFKKDNSDLKEEIENQKKINYVYKEENSHFKSDLDNMKVKLTRISETNLKLKESFDESNDINKNLLEGKIDEINELTRICDSLRLIKSKLELDMEVKCKECTILLSDLSFERSKNENLLHTCEEQRIMISTKDTNLASIIAEKKTLSSLTANLSNRNESRDNAIKVYEVESMENKSKISTLELFIEDLSKDKQNILKSREDLRKELMFTLEQCKNEHDVIEKKRNTEIETLKAQINSLTSNSSNNTKKSKNKINDLQALISQQKEEFGNLQKEMKDVIAEKNFIIKNLEISNMSMKDLSNKIDLKDGLIDEIALEKQNLKTLISDYESKVNILTKDLLTKDYEIIKLKDIEIEYHEMKNNIITNSPPISTQVPNYIKTCGSATPKSQRLSSRLQINNAQNLDGQMLVFEKQTPQKTPKSILRQPGSASKRRRVIFEDASILEQNIEICDDGSLLSDGVDIDLENIDNNNKSLSNFEKSPSNSNLVTTPKKPNLVNKLNLTDSRSVGRLNNIRKTPSKAPSKLNDKRKKDDKNWFDSDNFFGVIEP